MSDFIPFVQELLEGWGSVSARRMFGGHGFYHEGLMFAIVMDQRLYLKADELNRPEFEALGLTSFTYAMKGKDVALSYWAAPDAIFDAPEDAVHWAKSAWDAALRGHKAKAQASARAKAKLADKKAARSPRA
jgi:DNA transformation protein and related proteins